MRRLLPFNILFLSVLIALSSCKNDQQPGDSEVRFSFMHDEIEREYLFYAPPNLPQDASLVMVFHGFTSKAETIQDYTGYNELADQYGFAVAYPQGTLDREGRTFWNVGYDFHADSSVDDIDFVAQLMHFLQEKHGLSRTNTFAVGMSNGGELCYLLACYHPEMFRAIATVAATMMNTHYDRCSPVEAVPLLSIFGTADQTTNYEGDEANQDDWGAYKSIPDVIAHWAAAINYDTLMIDSIPDLVKTDSSRVVLETYRNKASAQEFLYYKVVGGDHDWPGAWGNEDMNASEEIWRFFERYLVPEPSGK